MSKLPKVKKQTWGKLIPSKWMLWACEDNDVHYLVLVDDKVTWMNTSSIDDCKDVIIFNKLSKAREFIHKCINRKLLPKGVVNIEYAQVVPSFEDGKLWYEIYDAKTGKVDWGIPVKTEEVCK